MSDSSKVVENLVDDLLSRVKVLEEKVKSLNEMEKALDAFDKLSFSFTIAVETISKVLLDKNYVTKEELTKFNNEIIDHYKAEMSKMKEENKGM